MNNEVIISNEISYIVLLNQWLHINKRNKSYLARECNVSPAAVKYWLDYKHFPSKKHREMIKELTDIEL